jgi:Tol biopolymer transport system component
MKGREGKFGAAAALALFMLQLTTACVASTRPADCGQRGVAVLADVGSLVAFACDLEPQGRYFNRDIFTVAPDGAPARRLTSGYAQDLDPAWSHDGHFLAFSSTRAGRLNLYLMERDGSAVRRLTSALAQEFEPSWSPDDRWIVFASGRAGAAAPLGPRGLPASLYVVHPDGSGLVRLTQTPSYDGDAVWSPDGSKIAFVSDRGGTSDVWVMNPDGSGQTRLTQSSAGDDRPSWSPDGRQIAFSRGGDDEKDAGVFVMDADGSHQRRLIAGEGREPAWSADGRWLAFVSERDGHPNIYVAAQDGSRILQLTADPAPKFRPSWRPK